MSGPVTAALDNWAYVRIDKSTAPKLGEGTFGDVFQGTRAPANTRSRQWSEAPLAVKFPKKRITTPGEQRMFLAETELMCTVNHPALLKLFAWTCDFGNGEYKLAMEFMPHSLTKILEDDAAGRAPAEWTSTRKSCVALALAAGMHYLHSRQILHRDLKPANVLLDSHFLPRISDFGLSKLLTSENQSDMTGNIGTPIYMAPELATNTTYTGKVDVYAFGIMLFELATGKRAFAEIRHLKPVQLVNQVINGARPKIPPEVPAHVAALMTACWDADPDKRPSFADMLRNSEQFLLEGAQRDAFLNFARDLLEEGKMELKE
jgi:serine/threonine protein kinase